MSVQRKPSSQQLPVVTGAYGSMAAAATTTSSTAVVSDASLPASGSLGSPVLAIDSASDLAVDVADVPKEPHFEGAQVIRDVIVGLSDGLTVPFALAAGLASLNNSRLVVTAGFAEIVAGSISMGLGGFLAGLSEIEHYDNERLREEREVETVPLREQEEIAEIFEPYGISREIVQPIIDVLVQNKEVWVDFMMKFELNLEKPDRNRTWISALTIGVSYFLGGLVPLIPYIFISTAVSALYVSAGVTILALFIFGYFKARMLGNRHPFLSALQMAVVGTAAAGAAFGIAKLIPQEAA
ncbi:Protein ccc1 [Polyrhizophydium stewartii]|uniref:Protein ccc1 n=1 Tax=Polyrhizophydium stewartii TaxID=2732419 RepID=A0ABR4MVG5_9FUNG